MDHPRPASPNGTGDGAAWTLASDDAHIGRIVAGLLDGELERRRPATVLRWVGAQLDIDPVRLGTHAHTASGFDFVVVATALGELIEAHAAAVTGPGGDGAPTWAALAGGSPSVRYPVGVLAALPAGELASFPVGLSVRPLSNSQQVTVIAAEEHQQAASQLLAELVACAGGRATNPYRGQVLHLDANGPRLDVAITGVPAATRDELVLPDSIWQELDDNVARVFDRAEVLQRAGLGLNRGVMLVGPPGTGKTAVTRVLAAEHAGDVTVMYVSPAALQQALEDVYELADDLAPSLVVLEDIDLVVGQRDRGGPSQPLAALLGAIDGAMTAHTGVVTLATTNDASRLHEAATRAARFDRIVEMPPPPLEARRRILTHYLAHLDGEVDTARLATATEGATGADLREIVRHAVLATDGKVTTKRLLHCAQQRGRETARITGSYL